MVVMVELQWPDMYIPSNERKIKQQMREATSTNTKATFERKESERVEGGEEVYM